MHSLAPRLPLRLEDAEVFEGVGLSTHNATASERTATTRARPPAASLSADLILSQASGKEAGVYESRAPFDRADALRQLKLALGVDVPPQLTLVPPTMAAVTPPCARTSPPPAVAQQATKRVVVSSPEMVLDQLRVLRGECHAIREWLGEQRATDSTKPPEALPGTPPTSLCTRQALCTASTVQELLRRVKGLQRARRCWPTTRCEFGILLRDEVRRSGHQAESTLATSDCTEALQSTVNAIGSLHTVENHMWRLVPLLERFRRLEPAFTEAAQRQDCFLCASDMTSEACQSNLQAMVTDAERFSAEMALAVERMKANHAALKSRAAALQGTRLHSSV